MPRFRKYHLHSEQFDGWLHAECGAGDVPAPNAWILSEDDFAKMPRAKCCRKCFLVVWPYDATYGESS